MRSISAMSVFLIAGATCCLEVDRLPRQSNTELTRGFDKIFVEWDAPGFPGGAVVLTDGGKVILERCSGLADIEHGIPITPATRVQIPPTPLGSKDALDSTTATSWRLHSERLH